MKKSKKLALRITLITLAVVGLLIILSPWIYPNIVTQIKPVKDPGMKAKVALDAVKDADNRDSALAIAIYQLPAEGNTLEERIAHWVGYELKKVDSMKFKMVSGFGISATNAEKKVKEGYTRDQVVVEIFSGGKSEEYFLRCANGLVSKRWSISEESIGNTRNVDHNTSISSVNEVSNTITITKGGSLCRDLGMTNEEASAFAEKYNLPHHSYIYNNEGKLGLFVKVHTGDQFHKVNGKWEPVEK